ncbi:MFS general substrate transporter [Pleurostoma richardsiae]|uniref:MFS general substrate transporter n=1 Tax=Pleurostoma richardsiae TaxID=41990 RepID=A0AA38S4R2_9PEZI|nr:MFS general substrate transporter [Pleurostoma richardsiae]
MATVVVPGTEVLIDEDQSEYIHTLQHAKKGDGRILLVPQPSLTDPNDPLRWSVVKKWIVFVNGLGYTFLGSFIGPMMSGGMVQQAAFFGVSITRLSWSAAIALFMSGIATWFLMPVSVKYGRRPVLLFSTLTMGVGCIWCAVAAKKSFASFFVGRAFAGFFAGPIEAIVPSTITDMFFLHDRGEKISIYGLSILGGNELGPVVSAYIIQSIGMSWAFYILAIAIFVLFISIFFTMPETAYYGSRPSISRSSALNSAGTEPATAIEKTEGAPTEKSTQASQSVSDAETGTAEVPKHSYAWTLYPFHPSYINNDISFKKAFLRPVILICYPTIFWATIVYGMSLCWNVVLALTVAQLFAPPPYAFGSGAQGLIFLSPFIGSMVGTYLCGPLGDQIATYYTRRNNGVREPEMRLPIAAVACFLTFAGVAISGPCYYYKTHWFGPIFGFGVLSTGAQMGANLSMTYAIDCHKELAGELMITISVWKSTLAWAWSWFINDWVDLNGMMTVYFIIAAINVVVYASTVLFYYKGKSYRIWIQEKNLFARYGLE